MDYKIKIARKIIPCILGLYLFTPSYVCAEDNQDNEDAAYNTPQYRYPKIEGKEFEFEDKSTIDDTVGMRTFNIPSETNDSFELTAAYQTYFQEKLDREIISKLADYNSAFTIIYKNNIGPWKHWQTIEVLVGEFAQDYCGETIDIVYLLKNSAVSAVFIDNSAKDLILSDSKCPKIPGYLNGGSEPPPVGIDLGEAFVHFCSERASCLEKYFRNPIHVKKLKSSYINTVRELQIK